MQHRKEIDGLRAIAVLPVILFHGGFDTFSGGYLGVDVFFVISGYLIAAILQRDMDEGRYSLLNFYERRARRILPALFVVMFASFCFAVVTMEPIVFRDFAQSLVATSLFVSNALFWMETGYFEGAAELKPLLHTWSLAVEEQYYLIFPIALALFWRFGRHAVLGAISICFLISLGAAEWASREMPAAAFFLTPFRIWELLAGAMLAIALQDRKIRGNGLLAGVGLAMVIGAMVIFDAETRAPSLLTLVPVLGTCLILLFARCDTWTGRILSAPPFVGVGLISYSAYLWHQPLFAFARQRSFYEPEPWVMFSLSVLTLILAWATWIWVEQPFRHRREAPPRLLSRRGPLFAGALAGCGVFSVLGVAGHVTDGRAAIWSAFVAPELRAIDDAIAKAKRVHREVAANPVHLADCVFRVPALDEAYAARLRACHTKHGPGVLVLGDSHAIDTFMMATHAIGTETPFLVGVSQGGCRPQDLNPECHYEDVLAYVAAHPEHMRKIIYNQSGRYLLALEDGSIVKRGIFDKRPLMRAIPPLYPASDAIETLVHYLADLAEHVPVTWLGPRLEHHVPFELIRRRGCETRVRLRPGQQEAFAELDKVLDPLSRSNGFEYISALEILDLKFPRDLTDCKTVFWNDGDHFSEAGEARFAPRLAQVWSNPERSASAISTALALPLSNARR